MSIILSNVDVLISGFDAATHAVYPVFPLSLHGPKPLQETVLTHNSYCRSYELP